MTFFGIVTAAACSTVAPPTNVLVSKVPAGNKALREEGANMKIRHWELDAPRRGLDRGYFVVKNEAEWRTLWPSSDADRIPLVPHDLDFSREMLLVASPPDKSTLTSEVKAVIETEQGGIHAYVVQQMPGESCPPKEDSDKTNFDLARVRRIDGKDVKFHIETTPGDACGEPPKGTIGCRPRGTTGAFQKKLSVAPGTEVTCIAEGLESARPIFDRTWTFASLPRGSFTKMTVGSSGSGVTFATDVFGAYRLQLEVTDDLQRRGAITTDIEVLPPSDALVVQLTWTKFDPTDDWTTFPRVALHAVGVPPAEAKRHTMPVVRWGTAKDCAAEMEKPPAWCAPKIVTATTVMTLDRSATRYFAFAVRYTDERVNGQPVLCLRTFREGKMRAEICDPTPRKDDSWWEVAGIDGESGKTLDELAKEAAAAEAAAAEAAEAAHRASAMLDGGIADDATAASTPIDGSVADATVDAGRRK